MSICFPNHTSNLPGLENPLFRLKGPSGIDGRLCKLFGTAKRASNRQEVFALSLFGQQYPRTCTFLSSARLRCAIADTNAQDLTLVPVSSTAGACEAGEHAVDIFKIT
jgi:hypothetical protein